MANYRYGAFDDGPDPLAPPYDVREALDEMGERILGGDNPRDALRDLLRRGWQERRDFLFGQVILHFFDKTRWSRTLKVVQ